MRKLIVIVKVKDSAAVSEDWVSSSKKIWQREDVEGDGAGDGTLICNWLAMLYVASDAWVAATFSFFLTSYIL